MECKDDYITCYIPKIVKNTSPSFHPGPIHLPAFTVDKSICPVELINEYQKLTKNFRKTQNLIISYSTFDAVSSQTIRNYIKTTLTAAGIDIKTFGAGSTRHASNSKKFQPMSLEQILKCGGWKTDSSFRKHYLKNFE